MGRDRGRGGVGTERGRTDPGVRAAEFASGHSSARFTYANKAQMAVAWEAVIQGSDGRQADREDFTLLTRFTAPH